MYLKYRRNYIINVYKITQRQRFDWSIINCQIKYIG